MNWGGGRIIHQSNGFMSTALIGAWGRVIGGGVVLRAFNSWNLFSEGLKYSGAGRDRGKFQHPWR